MPQENNVVGRDLAGRDINHYNDNQLLIKLFVELSKQVNSKLKKGVYNHYKHNFEPYCSKLLFESLLELAIPTEVALEIVKEVPNKIEEEISNSKLFSTRNIRSIVYNLLKRLDYSKFGEARINLWGENYIRKYGHSEIELKVLIEGENRYELLDRNFIIKHILPELYHKCYNSDIDTDLGLIKSKSILDQLASLILEKVRLLNLYQIRYSTLYKLSYDLAIQPPHHWFTDKSFKDNHLNYNIQKMEKHYNSCVIKNDVNFSAIEFIEHSCAAILSFYSLFIGLGKLRPLISLLNYLKLKDTNPIYWKSIELSNLSADLKAIGVNSSFYKFKVILEKIKYEIKDIENEYETILNHFNFIKNAVNGLYQLKNNLDNFSFTSNNIYELREKTFFLFNYFENVIIDEANILKNEFKYRMFSGDLRSDIRILFMYINNQEKQIVEPTKKNKDSNSILIISNIRIGDNSLVENINSSYLQEDFIFYLTLEDIYSLVKSNDRNYLIEKHFYKNIH